MPSSRSRRRRARSASAAPSSPGVDYRALTYIGSVPGLAILPLRLFLGLTFVYAGLQKITDPGFFTPGSRTYIGTQIISFARGSPIHFLLIHLAEHAVFFGILTILTELAIGVAVLLGLFTRLAALVGLSLNMVFFLSASWSVYPYFLGADIVFVMCWLTLAIAGPGGLSLDAALREPMSKRLSPELRRVAVGPVAAPPDGEELQAAPAQSSVTSGGLLTRGEALVALAATVGVVLLGLIPRGGPSSQVAATGASGKASSTPTSGSGGTSASNAPPGSTKVGNVSQLPANSALGATDPKSGDPAVVVHTSGSQIVAYDAVCTHAGCTVQYDPSYKLLVCPCHGGAFDPAHGAQVVGGPPPAPLTSLPINVDSKGDIFLG